MAGLRCVSVTGVDQPAVRIPLMLEMPDISIELGSPERALEYLNETGNIPEHQRHERLMKIKLMAEAEQHTLPAATLLAHLNVSIGEVMRYGDAALQAELLAMMATAHARTGATLRAIELEEQVMAICLKNGRTLQAGIAANNLAELLNKTPRAAESMELYQRAIILLDDAPMLRRSTLVNSAVAAALRGDSDYAERQLADALNMTRSADDGRPTMWVSNSVLSRRHCKRGETIHVSPREAQIGQWRGDQQMSSRRTPGPITTGLSC